MIKESIGIYTYDNGVKYEGEFVNGKKNGKGTCTYPNGDKYIGMWKNGQMDGQGIILF